MAESATGLPSALVFARRAKTQTCFPSGGSSVSSGRLSVYRNSTGYSVIPNASMNESIVPFIAASLFGQPPQDGRDAVIPEAWVARPGNPVPAVGRPFLAEAGFPP